MHKLLLWKILREIKKWLLKNKFKSLWILKQNLRETCNEHFFENKLGIETSGGSYSKDDLSMFKDSHMYSPTPYIALEEIITKLEIENDDIFVDIGCGKGRVIFYASRLKLKKVIGIELRKDMIDIAKHNLRMLKFRNTNIEIINSDIIDYHFNDGTIFFMYAPFGSKTLQKVLGNIKESLKRNQRKIRIVYFDIVADGVSKIGHLFHESNWLNYGGVISSGECAHLWYSEN